MIELLETLTLEQLLIYLTLIAIAFKACVDFFFWCKGLYQKKFDKDHNDVSKQEALEQHYENCKTQYAESTIKYDNLEKKIDALTEIMDTRIDKIEWQLERLTESDMHSHKSWIVEKHHNLMKQNWVDDFTMDTLEKRYADYLAEGGNSYVGGLMTELRSLPHFPPN